MTQIVLRDSSKSGPLCKSISVNPEVLFQVSSFFCLDSTQDFLQLYICTPSLGANQIIRQIKPLTPMRRRKEMGGALEQLLLLPTSALSHLYSTTR